MSEIRARHYGICMKLEPNFSVQKVPFSVDLNVTVLNQNDKPNGFMMFLTSKNTWHGVLSDMWPQFQATKVPVDFKDDKISIKIY